MGFGALFSLPIFLLQGYYNPEVRVSGTENHPSFSWYEYYFQSFFYKPVGVVLSMGQQSVERGYALRHNLGTLFSGSVMKTKEDQDSSTNRSKPSRLPSLKAFSSIFNRTNRSDVNSRFASPSLSCALGHSGSPPTSLFDHVPFAMHLRHKSNKREPAQREELVDPIQQLFMCGICLEEMPDDFIARPDSCGHTFCRECLRGYLTVRLEEHKFPILCPTCTVGKGKGKGVAGEVSQFLALDLGLNEEQYGIWTEMEMAAFAILLHCRECERTMFVAKDEYERVSIITCPLPDCNHTWCKECQQSTERGGPTHSCDGTSELDHLMKLQGWKYCPRCKTPIQKVSGCDHMLCGTPACNTHFCYRCGGSMRSGFNREIGEAHCEGSCVR